MRDGTAFACARLGDVIPDEAAYAESYAALPAWRRAKCDAFRFAADRRRSVAAWLLLKKLLAARGIAADTLTVRENDFGKPAFDPAVGLFFNLSHAGDRVLAVVGETPVGCDVERIARVRQDVVRLCYSESERAFVAAASDDAARARAFCRVWVRKEAYVKATGLGISESFASFSAEPGRFPSGWSCRDFDFGDGHLGAICDVARSADGLCCLPSLPCHRS